MDNKIQLNMNHKTLSPAWILLNILKVVIFFAN